MEISRIGEDTEEKSIVYNPMERDLRKKVHDLTEERDKHKEAYERSKNTFEKVYSELIEKSKLQFHCSVYNLKTQMKRSKT